MIQKLIKELGIILRVMKVYIPIFILFSFVVTLDATVCLNMIVKDEREVIEKCLASVKPLIDYWVIVDTGSTDGTQKIIKEYMKGIPGELHERPWVNFEHNRNEALTLAKSRGDYILLIDADEVLSYEPQFSLSPLTEDYYHILVRQIDAVDFLRVSLVKAKLPWKWVGILHEYIDCPSAKSFSVLSGVMNLCNTNVPSGRSLDPHKYLKDAAVFEEALKNEPNKSRYVYYLAQSYMAANQDELALKNYEKRAGMQSLDIQETFFAHYCAGKIRENRGDYEGALKNFMNAYTFHPTRAEPLFRASVVYRKMGNPFIGYLVSKYALTIPRPLETCVEYGPYEYGILVEFANCALLTGRWQEGLEASEKLLSIPNLPPDLKPSVVSNIVLAKKNLSTTISNRHLR